MNNETVVGFRNIFFALINFLSPVIMVKASVQPTIFKFTENIIEKITASGYWGRSASKMGIPKKALLLKQVAVTQIL